MRKGDLELLEVRLEPLQIARDRHDTELLSIERAITELRDQVSGLVKGQTIQDLGIEQGLASIRSLLQRANRAAREQGIIANDDELDTPSVETHNETVSPVRVRQAGNRRVI